MLEPAFTLFDHGRWASPSKTLFKGSSITRPHLGKEKSEEQEEKEKGGTVDLSGKIT